MLHHRRSSARPHSLWPAATALAAALALLAPAAYSASGVDPGGRLALPAAVAPIISPATGEVQSLNQALLVERLLAQFYNQNAGKPYLTSSGAVTNPPGTTTPGIASEPSPADANSPAATADLAFTSTLSGAAMIPPVNSSATASAQFVLGKDRRTLTYEVRLSGLSSPVTAIHLHQAKAGEPGGIIHWILENPVNNVSSGQLGLRPEELDPFMNGEFFIEVHTEQFPTGELRGQVALAGTAPPGSTVPPGLTVPPGTPVIGTLDSLRGMAGEFRDHHNAHVAVLEQSLGTSAQPSPTFPNLDMPTLTQFVTLAVGLEDFATGAHQFLITNPAPGASSELPTLRVAALLVAIDLDDARHAGALRAYRKLASTAAGGDPTIPITPDGAFNTHLTVEQMNAFLQPYLATPGTTTPVPGTGTNPPVTGGQPPTY